MKRREFFGSILLLGAAFGMPWPETGTSEAADSSAISAPRDQPGRAVLLLSSALAGFQYYGGTSLWPQLQTVQSLHLVREPDNAFDSNAIRIKWSGAKIGYVPRMENSVVAELMDRGERVSASIVSLAVDDDPWVRIGMEIGVVV